MKPPRSVRRSAAARHPRNSIAPPGAIAGLAAGLAGVLLSLLAAGRAAAFPAAAVGTAPADAATPSPPILAPALDGGTERAPRALNLYSQEGLLACVQDGNEDGLRLDLSLRPELLDGTRVDAARIRGTVWIAPFPVFEATGPSDAVQFRRGVAVREGRAALELSDLDNGPGWPRRGQVLLRAQLALERDSLDRDLGTYEFLAGFRRDGSVYRRAAAITEGPFVCLTGDPATSAVIRLRTVPPADVVLTLQASSPDDPGAPAAPPRTFASGAAELHEIALDDLEPDQSYRYRLACDSLMLGWFVFRTAPPPGEGTIRFAFGGDSRQSAGGGARAFMGVNALVLSTLLRDAAERDVRFWLHGGDLVSGYTGSVEDFRAQLRAFKWTATPFLRERPIFCAMGNHDCVVRAFAGGAGDAGLDRWPYATESSEAVFADELTHPRNGPVPEDPRRPPYCETVYSLRYGPVEAIVLNNNYWVSTAPAAYGGSPEGFLFPDQMRWLEAELARAAADSTVRHVFLCLQEPPLPNSAHLKDAMWYHGDARVRAFVVPPGGGRPMPEPLGVIEARDALLRLAAATRKVVAVLGSDEHNYSRLLLTPETPAGDPGHDDRDGDGRLDAPLSPMRGLARPLWYIISGGAGAPHYPESESPWNRWWKDHRSDCPEPAGCYRFSLLNHWVLFEVDAKRVSLEARSVDGKVIDRVPDLRAALR